jgi:hypothetical protein
VTEPDGDRAQDVGRSHKPRGIPAPETLEILERYRAAMRAELSDTLDEIRPATGQLTLEGAVTRAPLETRRALWDLAIKLGRELGNGSDPAYTGEPGPGLTPAAPSSRRAPRLTAAQRRALGAE